MALEALTCATCGSPDVQEVKASTYFCNHYGQGAVPGMQDGNVPAAMRCGSMSATGA